MSRIRKCFLFTIAIISLINSTLCEGDGAVESVKVEVNQGVLSGKVERTFMKHAEYYSFKGVPYAEPPVGVLRFQPPKPIQKWEGIYQAYDNKPTCLQFNSRSRIDEPFGISGSEDCLFLSVFTPGLEGSYPVVVFDYNDNFITGFNGTDTYSPDFFIEEGVIVVYITHRLGVFGYLTTDDDVIPANNGIRDFILGLQWIQDNIEQFGGDPNRVTLMGYKGGAALMNILLYSEKAKGLFSSVIMQSGTALEAIYFPENPKAKAFELGKAVDIETDDSKMLLGELQNADGENILRKDFMIFDSEELKKTQMNINTFAPTVEKDSENAILTALPEKGNIVNDVPVIIGLTSREGLDLTSHFIFRPYMLQDVLGGMSMHFPIRPGFRFDRDSTIFNMDVARDINEFYYKDGYLHTGNILEYSVLIGDTLHNYAIDYAAKRFVRDLESPVFYYMFDYRGTINENSEYMARYAVLSMQNWGATVADDICYLHLCSRIKKTYQQLKKLVSEQQEFKVLKKMVRLWTNFVKTGNPTPGSGDSVLKDINWRPMAEDDQNANYLHITKTFKMKTNPLGKRANFWDEFLDKYSKITIDGVVPDVVKEAKNDVDETENKPDEAEKHEGRKLDEDKTQIVEEEEIESSTKEVQDESKEKDTKVIIVNQLNLIDSIDTDKVSEESHDEL
ncbi:esterase E4-like [Pectinophora gossypiella]|uniref:esterase E4-like n=1 Tax=Pectinophora gossypiella TaxID=13191 RepID=UPI00214E804C|nr:esterase E4-like [Pectinophora gossypiella]